MTSNAERCDFALVVGINEYAFDDLTNLKGAENDARRFIEWLKLKDSFGDLNDEDRIISKFSVVNFSDLRILVTLLLKRVGSGGRRLYVFLAGHGCGQSIKDAYLYASEHSTENEACWDIIHDVTQLGRLFQEVVLFADCCRAEAQVVGVHRMNLPGLNAKRAPKVYFYCLGCVNGESTYEELFENEMHGVFSNSLLRALRGEVPSAIDSEGNVTAHTLTEYLTSLRGEVNPHIDPINNAEQLRRIVFASGLRAHYPALEVRLRNPSAGFSVFGSRIDKRLQPRQTETPNGIMIERDTNEVLWIAVPEVEHLTEAEDKKPVYPNDVEVEI